MFLMHLLLNIKYIWRLRMILVLCVSNSLWWPRRPCTTFPSLLVRLCLLFNFLSQPPSPHQFFSGLNILTPDKSAWIIPSSLPGLHLKLCFYNYFMWTHIHIHKLLPFPDLLVSIECFLIWYYILQLQLKCKF